VSEVAFKVDKNYHLPYAAKEDLLIHLMHQISLKPFTYWEWSYKESNLALQMVHLIAREKPGAVVSGSADYEGSLQLTTSQGEGENDLLCSVSFIATNASKLRPWFSILFLFSYFMSRSNCVSISLYLDRDFCHHSELKYWFTT
jgi:hypothetical protein